MTTLPEPAANLLPFEGDVRYYPALFPAAESDDLFQRLERGINWKQEPIKLFGKEVMQPRLTAGTAMPESRTTIPV